MGHVLALGRKERPFSGHFSDDGMAGSTSAPAFESQRRSFNLSVPLGGLCGHFNTEYTDDVT